MLSQGFVQHANLSFNRFRAARGTIEALAAGIPSILPVGISVWGGVYDRFSSQPRAAGAYFPFSADIHVEGNVFEGEFSGPNWANREDHVSPQALVSVRTINVNGVKGVTFKGNVFSNSGNITDNLCLCCTVVDTPKGVRCSDVKTLV